MYIKNITFSVSNEICSLFEVWVKNETLIYSDWVKKTDAFKLLTQIDEQSSNYSVQFFFDSKEQLDVFKQLHLDLFLVKAQQRFGGNLLYFVTLLERI